METIILPGFSVKNKEWADETKKELDPITPTLVIYYPHWETGKTETDWIKKEAEKVIDTSKGQPFNLLAKSIGTMIAMVVLKSKPELINKLILCGVPIRDFQEGNERYYESLKDFPLDRILCIQNQDDNHGSFNEVKIFLQSLAPNLKIISKPRSDHEYPYSSEFIHFLTP